MYSYLLEELIIIMRNGKNKKGSNFESIFMVLDLKIKQSKIIFEYELNKELKL